MGAHTVTVTEKQRNVRETANIPVAQGTKQRLNSLNLTKGMSEARLTVPQAVDTLACQEVCGSVESESNDQVSVSQMREVKAVLPREEVHEIDLLTILFKHELEED